ncbi:hypothetical protein DPMN_098993 [Dreissena polymorpha]|uniref:Uncharacterized protein n=1 Tax=Dreissena polymorpha TaxID=45954 RepID=A0A9D4LE33_DREPO|nr:hypothetical protein DPMN_098993 [Dreissena polymorpha]
MLEELNLETLESRRTKYQLTMLHRIVNKLVNIDANKYLKPQKRCLDTRTDQASCLSLLHLIPSRTAFSHAVYHFGTTYQHPLLRPPLWHPSKVGYPA